MFSLGYKTKKDLAKALNISTSDLSNRTKSGTAKQLLIDLAVHKNVNTDWLLTGKGNMSADAGVAKSQPPYNANSTAPRISELLTKTAAVLESSTIFSSALKSNIDAFHHALHCEEQLAIAIQRIDDLEEWKKSVEKRLPSAVNGS